MEACRCFSEKSMKGVFRFDFGIEKLDFFRMRESLISFPHEGMLCLMMALEVLSTKGRTSPAPRPFSLLTLSLYSRHRFVSEYGAKSAADRLNQLGIFISFHDFKAINDRMRGLKLRCTRFGVCSGVLHHIAFVYISTADEVKLYP